MNKVPFGIELDQNTLEQIDAWRAMQPGQLSQADAVERLVVVGLAVADGNEVRFSDGEKLIMMMLRDLYEHQNVNGDIDPEFIQEALLGGHYWGLKWQLGGLLHDHADSVQTVSEVVDILEMWYFIESGYAALSEPEKTGLKEEAKLSDKDIQFPGFDGNHESEYLGIAQFLVNQMERFEIFKGRVFNSHTRSIEMYRRMLFDFKLMRGNLGQTDLSPTQIIALLKPQIHPESK